MLTFCNYLDLTEVQLLIVSIFKGTFLVCDLSGMYMNELIFLVT